MATNDQCYCRQNGGIHLILGPMFSGKTTELFRLSTRQNLAGKKVGIVKYARDTRYDENMASTHDCKKMEAIAAEKIADIYDQLLSYDVIGIDEGQFFSDIVDYAEILANRGKVVFIAALDGNFAREPFECISKLLAFAESACKLTAVCHNCGKPAPFTYRKIEDEQVSIHPNHFSL
uniref:Thymidine kinase n=1 Tax=Panagrolaimus superbus TaxID=310955 RepID=A0A914Z325_9BILA